MAFWSWLIPKRETPICVRCRWYKVVQREESKSWSDKGKGQCRYFERYMPEPTPPTGDDK